MREHLEQVQAQAENWKPEEILSWAFATYGKDVAIASGFGVEGMVLLDLASRVRRDFRVFTLDTEFLFSETYDLMDRVEKRYGIKVERVYSTLTPEEQEREHGAALWSAILIDAAACARSNLCERNSRNWPRGSPRFGGTKLHRVPQPASWSGTRNSSWSK